MCSTSNVSQQPGIDILVNIQSLREQPVIDEIKILLHDLAAQLAIASSYLSLVLHKRNELCAEDANHLLHVENVLEAARLNVLGAHLGLQDEGHIHVRRTVISATELSHILRNFIRRNQIRRNTDIQILIEVTNDFVLPWADRHLLKLVIEILLNNVVTSTYPRTIIYVTAQQDSTWSRITVNYCGLEIGILDTHNLEASRYARIELWTAGRIMGAHGGRFIIHPSNNNISMNVELMFPVEP